MPMPHPKARRRSLARSTRTSWWDSTRSLRFASEHSLTEEIGWYCSLTLRGGARTFAAYPTSVFMVKSFGHRSQPSVGADRP
eukprot:5555343-Prymnesium_polylepis.1